MRKIFTLFSLFFCVISYSQQSPSVKLEEALAGKMGCGIISQDQQSIQSANTIKPVNLNNNLTVKAEGLNIHSECKGPSKITLRCCRILTGNNEPLLLVDQNILPLSYISDINPELIESVEIIKSAPAAAIFGSNGANGAIVITTKKAAHWKLIIKDQADNNPLPGTTVSVKNKKTGYREYQVANDSGYILLDKKIYTDSIFYISATGYKTQTIASKLEANNTEATIFLKRDEKVCEEVVVLATVCPRTIRCGGRCIIRREKEITSVNNHNAGLTIRTVPNLLQKGQQFNITIKHALPENASINIYNATGNLLQTINVANTSSKNTITATADSRWSAGVYFVQLQYANGRQSASERIIIQ